jgi:hypothetical protein
MNHIYDIETFPNVFTLTAREHETGVYNVFEISTRRNDIAQLWSWVNTIAARGDRMVGFNNIGFDYPVLHYVLQNYNVTPELIYSLAAGIIHSEDRWGHIIWDNDRIVPQIDLFKIHHFDNVAKYTSLKMLEYNMRSHSVQELPFAPGTPLTHNQIDILLAYNKHDVDQTEQFFIKSSDHIKFREYLSEKYSRNFMNHNDTKIGKDFFIMELEKANPGCCYQKTDGRRTPRQTPRPMIAFRDIIFPYVRFEHPEFNRILQWFQATTITETKGSIEDLTCTVNGFTFVFGTGGIHGSIDSTIIESDENNIILDLDVTSFYPSLGIVNRIYPKHLGEVFCDIYAEIKKQRVSYAKNTPENKMLKLALNGTYGDTNNQYSPFYDPQYTMSITINGQLVLCMLAEQMMKIPELQMIQINTDGLTVRVDRRYLPYIEQIKKWWCDVTMLELEEAFYDRMIIRDVNSYIGINPGGKLKRKGAYEYDMQWHQNQSALVVPKAAEAALVRGEDIETFIHHHPDIMDFMLRTKVPRNSRLVMVESDGTDRPMQNITRYYISRKGGSLVKIMNPLKGKTVDRRIGINVGWKATPVNEIRYDIHDKIDFRYYINEAKKLVDPLKNETELLTAVRGERSQSDKYYRLGSR